MKISPAPFLGGSTRIHDRCMDIVSKLVLRLLFKFTGHVLAACLVLSAATASADPAESDLETSQKAEEILVVGRRSGIPMWRVSSDKTTLILVGTIDGVTKATRWDPEPLVEALRMSDRVMFPQTQVITASPFAMAGYLAKWRRQAKLPKGQTLEDFLPPEQFQRLLSLQQRGIAKKGAEKKHPLHLAFSLRDDLQDEVGSAQSADRFVMKAIRKHKLKLVPIQKSSAKDFAADLFGASPSRDIPCLIDAMDLAEAGPSAVTERSIAWAEREVAQVLNSPAEGVYHSCFPADSAMAESGRAALHEDLERLLNEPQITVAVLDLHALASEGGILDRLAAAYHEISGPAWR